MESQDSAFIDPFCVVPTLSLTCTIAETGTKEAYTRDPRGIAGRAEKYLKSTGVADTAAPSNVALLRRKARALSPGRGN